MALYDIKRACGHLEEVQIYGPIAQRDRKAEYEATRVCRRCWKEENLVEAEAAQAQAREAGLPDLEGTPQQVSWAVSIRARLLPKLGDLRNRLEEKTAQLGGRENLSEEDARELERLREALAWIEHQTSETFWLDHRDKAAPSLLRLALGEVSTKPEGT